MISISKTHKIRLLFLFGFTILLVTIFSSSPTLIQSNLSSKHSSASLRKSPTSFAPLLELSEAINSLHDPIPHSRHQKSFPCDDITPSTSPRFAQRGSFWALYNFIQSRRHPPCDQAITYTTHSEYSYLLENLGPLLKRWMGPVSLSVYVPGSDFGESLRRLVYLRECGPDADLVQSWVSVHFFFDQGHVPEPLPLLVENLLFTETGVNCSHPWIANFEGGEVSYRSKSELPYPINMGRNIAKEAATTKYVLPSDIELYPSPGLIPNFLEMIKKSQGRQSQEKRRVWVLPIFEADGKLTPDQLPQNKVELVGMLKSKMAVPFHYRICPKCHKIPRADDWMEAEVGQGLAVFHVTNRTGAQAGWEPIYIGTKDEPGYDERLNWEGLKDKMTQGFLLCVLDYEMAILDNAFLIHSPGIRSKGPTYDVGRKKFITKQTKVVTEVIEPELKLLYGDRDGCRIIVA